ncbi:MAG: T9SS C-terminal target domain-containing protein, partial [Candidatus Zixiibacteriota bacterium]
ELGHYLFSFNEEYEFNDSAGRCFSVPDYGFMDYPYSDGGAYASEMSNQSMYTFADCRNTKQYATYGVSCWEMFETDFEGTYGPDNVFVPVRHPDSLDVSENIIPAGYNYIPGPNDDLSAPNYDVGALVQFPQSHSAPSGFTIEVVTHDFQLNRLGGIDVTLRHPVLGGGWSDVYQGQSSDVLPGGMQGGGIYVLGAVTGDKIQASSQYTLMGAPSAALSPAATFNWLVGETTVGLPGDTVRLTLTPVQGNYPLIVRPELHGDTTRVMLDFEQAFNQMPSLELSGSPQNYAFQAEGNSYTTAITDSMSTSGTMTVWCRDAADVPYFFSSAYVIYRSDSGLVGQLASPDGACTLVPDTAATAPREAIIVVSPYPVLTTGLSPETKAVSAAYGIALDTSVVAGHQLTIRYSDKDLSAGPNRSVNEGSLTMYRWDDQTSAWIDLVSIQDTANNEVTAAIPGDGVYALLSPDIITDVDNDNSPLPNTFALGQNYPNPFNPTTTIEYSIPRRSRVVIDIFNVLGQSVRRLVDEKAEAGTHSVVWDGRTNGGRPVASGVYLYRITAGEFVRTRKMLLLK